MDGFLKDIPDRNPVFTGALHTDILAVIVKEPLFKSKQATVISGETLLLIRRLSKIASNDGGDEKSLVYIDATADWISAFHDVPPSRIEKRETVTVPPHIKPR